MLKYNRNYILEIQTGDGQSVKRIDSRVSPLTLEFSISFELLSSVNAGTLRIHNLSEETRRSIYHDAWDLENVRFVKLRAGYGDNFATILYGNIAEAMSYRDEGSTSMITEIHTYDWSHAFTNAHSKAILSPFIQSDGSIYYPQRKVIGRIIEDLGKANPDGANVVPGYISQSFNYKYQRSRVLSGNSWELLKTETQNHCFICNGVVNCLLEDEYVENNSVFEVSEDTGLLSTPKKSGTLLSFDMLFEPSLILGQRITLISKFESMYNTQTKDSASGAPYYKIFKLSHSGTISGAVNAKCKTSVSVNAGIITLNPVTGQFVINPGAL